MKTGHKRLLKLARILRDVPRKQFNMHSWYNVLEDAHGYACGTTVCAVGHACEDPGFRRAGLHLIETSSRWSKIPALRVPGVVRVIEDWPAVIAFFDLSGAEAKYLFVADGVNNTPKQVAKKIERFVLGQETLPGYLRG